MEYIFFTFLQLAHLTAILPILYAYKYLPTYVEFFVLSFTTIASSISHFCWSDYHLCLFGTVYGRFWLFLDMIFSYFSIGVVLVHLINVRNERRSIAYIIILTYAIISVSLLDGQYFFFDPFLCKIKSTKYGFQFGMLFGIIAAGIIVFSNRKNLLGNKKGYAFFAGAVAIFIYSEIMQDNSDVYNIAHGGWHALIFISAYYFLQD